MCQDSSSGSSGSPAVFTPYETRRIIIAQSNEFHESDYHARDSWRQQLISRLNADITAWKTDDDCLRLVGANPAAFGHKTDEEKGQILLNWAEHSEVLSLMQVLERDVGSDFMVRSDGLHARYVSHDQQVVYEIEIVQRRSEFKTALETEGIIVIYSGHSRYGRGTAFDHYDGRVDYHGNQWGDGRPGDDDTGIFYLGYPFVPIPFSDIEHHQYEISPMPVEEGHMPHRHYGHPWNYHPHGNRTHHRVTLPEELRSLVRHDRRSASNRYWGIHRSGEWHVFLPAGWESTHEDPYDLGATNIVCRTFCHFGCSSQLHYWNIVRRRQYKAYRRDTPPTTRLAYFTTAPSTYKTIYWLVYLLLYDGVNSPSQYFASHEYAKHAANQRLRAEHVGFQFY